MGKPVRDHLLTASAMIALSLLLLLCLSSFANLADDAFISFRYAANLAAGEGPVYNPGERVEGYTNPLLVFITAAFIKLGVTPAVGIVWLGILCALLLLPLAYAVGRHIAQEQRASPLLLVAPLLIAANPNVGYWSVTGLETIPFTLLALLGLYRYLREQHDAHRLRIAGFVFALCYLMRPDGALFFVAAMIHRALFPRLVRGRAELFDRARAALPVVVPFAVIVAAHVLFRRLYYDSWLPNTFYAKTGGSIPHVEYGLNYVHAYVATYGGYLVHLLPILYVLLTGVGSGAGLLLLSIGLYLVFVTAVGGDYSHHFRMIVPVIPLLAVVWQEALRRLWRREVEPRLHRRTAARAAVAVIVAGAVLALSARVLLTADVTFPWMTYVNRGFSARRAWSNFALLIRGQAYWMSWERACGPTVIGRWLARHCPEDTLIASRTAGRIPYYSGLPTIDMLGLCDRHIARATPPRRSQYVGHEKYDGRYVVSRAPDIIVVSLGRTWRHVPPDPRAVVLELSRRSPVMHDVVHAPGFWGDYRYALVALPGRYGYADVFLHRKARVPRDQVAMEWTPGQRGLAPGMTTLRSESR